jgi:uncharacterized protein (DUF1778 family)
METITVELKLDLQQQQLLQQAAANRGFTLPEYLLELALNSIDEGIPTWEKIELNTNNAQLLEQHLNYPPVANPALQAAIFEHQQQYGQW